MNCLHCGATVHNGLGLCELCQRKARTVFEFLPIYFRNLARWRPGRAGSRPVPGSRVLYDGVVQGDGTGDRISDRLDEAANALVTWARLLAEARPHVARLLDRLEAARAAERVDEVQLVAWLCTGFDRFLTSVATLDWCGEFIRELDQHEAVLRGLTETLVPGWYAGACKRCNASTYVVPGLTWVACGSCGVTTYARDHLETIRYEARGWVARPRRLAEAVVALVDTEVSVEKVYTRIRQWSHTGALEPIRRTARDYAYDEVLDSFVTRNREVGHARYRFGEVLDLVLARDTRARAGADGAAQVS